MFCLLPCSTSVTIFFVLLLLLNRYLMVLLSLLFANYLGVLLLLLTVILWFCFRYCQSCCCYCLLPYSNAAVTACYLIVLLLCFHNIKPELSVELDRTLVIDLHNIGVSFKYYILSVLLEFYNPISKECEQQSWK